MNILKNPSLEESILFILNIIVELHENNLIKNLIQILIKILIHSYGTFSDLPTNRLVPRLTVARVAMAQAVNELFDTSPTKAPSEALGTGGF